MNNSKKEPQDTRQVFRECGTCSRTFGHLLNREFGFPKDAEERALDPLAGGMMNQGHQCGMLWGATLAVGAEAFRRYGHTDRAIAVAVTATRQIIESFVNRTNAVNCREIIGIDLSKVFGLMKFIIKTTLQSEKNNPCYHLAEQWAPEAIGAAREGLSGEPIELTQQPVSCASEVAKKMGASEEESVLVAGFAGGLGLSGHGCGALSAAVWMKTLAWCKENPGKSPPYFNNPSAKKILKAFYEATDGEMLCPKISGKRFESIEDHSEFINNGGCAKLMDILAQAS